MNIKFSSEQVAKILDAVSEASGEAVEIAYRTGFAAGAADYDRRVNVLIKLGVLPPTIKRQLIFANLVIVAQ